MTREAQDIMNAAMVEWQDRINGLPQHEAYRLESELATLATHAARLSAYISRRLTGGKHDDAVKAQNTAARKVRQALGYTYADDSVRF